MLCATRLDNLVNSLTKARDKHPTMRVVKIPLLLLVSLVQRAMSLKKKAVDEDEEVIEEEEVAQEEEEVEVVEEETSEESEEESDETEETLLKTTSKTFLLTKNISQKILK